MEYNSCFCKRMSRDGNSHFGESLTLVITTLFVGGGGGGGREKGL